MKKAVVGVVIVLAMVFVILTGKYLAKKFLSPAPVSHQASTYYKVEDINKDGTIDSIDEQILTKQFGCQKAQPCWNKVIGKTVSGDNPIYASDLDLNGDGVIDALDLQRLKNAE